MSDIKAKPRCPGCYETTKAALLKLEFGRYAAVTSWCESCGTGHHVKWRDLVASFGTEEQRAAAAAEAARSSEEFDALTHTPEFKAGLLAAKARLGDGRNDE